MENGENKTLSCVGGEKQLLRTIWLGGVGLGLLYIDFLLFVFDMGIISESQFVFRVAWPCLLFASLVSFVSFLIQLWKEKAHKQKGRYKKIPGTKPFYVSLWAGGLGLIPVFLNMTVVENVTSQWQGGAVILLMGYMPSFILFLISGMCNCYALFVGAYYASRKGWPRWWPISLLEMFALVALIYFIVH